jgi:hypothetical protein
MAFGAHGQEIKRVSYFRSSRRCASKLRELIAWAATRLKTDGTAETITLLPDPERQGDQIDGRRFPDGIHWIMDAYRWPPLEAVAVYARWLPLISEEPPGGIRRLGA